MNIQDAIDDALTGIWSKYSDRNWIFGRLGIANGTDYDIDVPNKAGYKYVRIGVDGELGATQAIDAAHVAAIGDQRIKMRRENRQLVIRDAQFVSTGGSGGASNLFDLGDVSLSTLTTGDALTWDGTAGKWINRALASVDPTLFLLRDGSRSLTGNLAVDTGITIDGVDISVHAADPNAHHHIATAGNTAIGIDGSQGISLVLATGSGLAIATGLKIDVTHSFTWTGTHQFNVTPQINANLNFIGGDRSITSASGDDITINLGGDFILASAKTFRSGDYSDGIPIAGFSVFINTGGDRQLTINTIKSDSIHTRLLIYDGTRIDIGEEYWSKSVGVVHDDFISPSAIGGAVFVYFEDSPRISGAIFSNNDWLLFQYIDGGASGATFNSGYIWGQVDSYVHAGSDPDGRGYQRWTFHLRHGDVSQLVEKHNVAIDFGASGQGYVHLSTLSDDQGPWIRVGTWTGSDPFTAGNNQLQTQIGNLAGISDTALNPAGYGLYSDNAYLHGVVRTAETVMDDDGLALLYSSAASGSDPGAHATFSWWPDVSDTSGIASARIAAWKNTSGSPHYDRLSLLTRQSSDTGGASLSLDTVRTDGGGSGGSAILIDSHAGIFLRPDSGAHLVSVEGDILPEIDLTYNIGSASLRWNTLYVDQLIVTGAISGSSIGGQTWSYPGSMTIDATGSVDRTVSVANSGTGRADLNVDRDIIVGGTVDGVDISIHAADPAAHHNPATGGLGITVSGSQVVAIDTAAVVQTSLTIGTTGALAGGGTLAANRTLSLTLATTSGLNQTSGLAVGAGAGISVLTNTVAVHLATSSGLNTTSGLAVDGSIAGAGLTMTSGVLNVIALTTGGLTVNANDVQIKLPVASGLVTDSTGLYIDDAVAGAGLAISSKILAVGAGLGITVNVNDVAVNQATNFAWTGNSTFAGTSVFNGAPTFNNDIAITGARTITSNSTNNLTITPGGDLVLNPSGANVLPGGSITIDLGDYNRKWRTLFASELYVETLVAQDVMATIGGRVMVAPTTTLIADVNTTQTTIDVKHNNLSSGHFVILETAPGGVAQIEAMKVTSAATTISGGYRYTVVRNQDATGANSWVAGDAIVDLGAAVGSGYIDLTSTSTIHGALGPTVTIYSRTATTNWNDTKPVVTMGNLSSFVGYGATEFGFAVGNDLTKTPSTGFSGLTADRTNGLRMFNTEIDIYSGSNKIFSINQTDGVTFEKNAGTGSLGWIQWYDDLADLSPGAIAAIKLTRAGVSHTNVLDINAGAGGDALGEGFITISSSTQALTNEFYIDTDFFGFLRNSGLTKVGIGFSTLPASTLHVYENNTTTGAAAGLTIEQDGTGDAIAQFLLTGVVRWIAGIDNSDSDKFKINNTALGTTDKFALDGSGNLTVAGNLRGDGITFDGTNVMSSYVENPWTPAIKFGASGVSGISYSLQSGFYRRIGSFVHCWGKITLSSKGTSTGVLSVTGLPFTVNASFVGETPITWSNIGTTAYSMFIAPVPGSTTANINLVNAGNTSPVNMQDTNVNNTSVFIFSFSYFV